MYLKRLEIFGFKTFAEKTEILFTPGVTAVIGPNGSGKSNVGDAVLWVLGEQNIRALRGSSSQDVIFAGNDRRKPLGMAEVSLTIDNSARILPLEFAEVTVTRRVYRSGEGEFFINRVSCRLRDIYELFLDTGIGRDAYSFVNQSEIDAILSVRAEDRRAIFEEAAGIKKYRVRKREALKKLENTRANLARVNDIIGEIDGQLEPLRRQAQVARRYRELSERLREIELAWYATALRRLTAEGERLGVLIAGLYEERGRLERQLEAVRADEADRRTRLYAVDVELERLRLEETEQARQLAHAESQAALLVEREENARRQAEALGAEIGELTARGEELRARGAAAAAEQAEMAKAIRERRASRAELMERVAAGGRDTETLQRALEARRAHLIDLARRQASARNQVGHLQSRERTLQAAWARLEIEREECRTEEARAHRLATEAEVALQELDLAAVESEAEHDRLVEKGRSTAAEQKAAAAERDRLAGELAAARARRHALSELAESFQGYAAGARAVLIASKDGALPSGFRPLLEALRLPPGLELAVEAALGPSAQAVLAPSVDAARQAVDFLSRRGAGRATLLPPWKGREKRALKITRTGLRDARGAGLSRARLASFSQDSAAPSGSRPASLAPKILDLIQVDGPANTAARSLLGSVRLVDDLDAAMREALSAAALPGGRSPASFVTRDGALVSAGGWVSGGREGKQADSSRSLLARRREMDELQDVISDVQARVETAQACVERIQGEAAALAQEQAALQTEIDQQRYRREELRREQKRGREELERIARAALRLSAAEAANVGEREDTAAALTKARADAEEAEFDNAALEAEVERARRELEERQSGLRAVEREAADARVEVASLEEQARALDANARRLGESAGSVERQARARRDQAAALTAERESLARQRAECREAVRDRSAELARVQTAAETRRGERSGHADQLEAASAHLRELSERANELLQRAHRAELERTAAETERTHLTAQLASDYELTPEDLGEASALNIEHPTPNTPPPSFDPAEIARLRRQLKGLGPVNPDAIDEYDRLSDRYSFLSGQRDDLEAAQDQIGAVIREIDATTRETFMQAFQEIGAAFDAMFQRLFGGGRTELVLTDPSDVLETGIEIIVQPPGKKLQNLLLLSGGERALTASAMLFALLKVRPSPFCVLDEVDAPLDEANVGRFGEVLREFAERSQFIVVTHNRGTMEAADTLYGVTMEEPGISKLISVRLDDVAEEAAPPSEARWHLSHNRTAVSHAAS